MRTRKIITLMAGLALTTALAAQPAGRKAWNDG